MRDNTAMAEHEVRNEVERYIAVPGQALSYFIGRIRIDNLRAHARQRLGRAFDLAEFHHQVLSCGNVPLDVLDRVVEDWIETREMM
jgi:uncharacterized protein (DUF885 family)